MSVPGVGIHSYRMFGVAGVDLVGTVVAGVFVAWLFDYSYLWVVGGLLVVGEVVHLMFGIETAVVRYIFGRIN